MPRRQPNSRGGLVLSVKPRGCAINASSEARIFHLDRLVSFLARAVFLWTLVREARKLGVLLELGGVAWATFPFWSSIFNQKSLVDCRNSSAFDIDMVLSLTTPGSMRGVLTLTYPACFKFLAYAAPPSIVMNSRRPM